MRIRKCTGSAFIFRLASVVLPALIMLASTAVGAYMGNVASNKPWLFLVFISFGIVALMCLACNELLWEARTSLNGENDYVSAIVLFGAMYLIIAMDKVLPK